MMGCQIWKNKFGFDPLNPESDADGISDGAEVQTQGDPKDISDDGSENSPQVYAIVKLTVGNRNGIDSERYILQVGGISQQSQNFGDLSEDSFKFKPGTYPISVKWIATKNTPNPNYGYTAKVSKVSGNANIRIQGMRDKTADFKQDKTADFQNRTKQPIFKTGQNSRF